MRNIPYYEFMRGEPVESKLAREFNIGNPLGYRELGKNPLSRQLSETKWFELGDFGRFGFIYLISPDNVLTKIAILLKNSTLVDYKDKQEEFINKLKDVMNKKRDQP